MNNPFGLDADYFIRLCAREFSPEVIRNQTPDCLARAFARAARTACAGVLREDEFNWEHLAVVGQVKKGDKLRMEVGGKTIRARVKAVINAGTELEEVVYNQRKNHYFITAMAINGTSSHKNVQVRIRQLEGADHE